MMPTGSDIESALRELVSEHLPGYDGLVYMIDLHADRPAVMVHLATDVAERSGLLAAIDGSPNLTIRSRAHVCGGDPTQLTLTVAER